MSFFSQLVMYIGIIGIIFLVGLPIAHINRRKNECSIQIVGGWGLATIVLVCFWLSVFGVAIKKVSIIIFIVTICLYAYLVLTKKKTLKIKIKEYYPIICALLAGILSMFPTLFYNAQSVYGDEFTYICIADFLVDNGYNTSIELSPLYPWLTQMKLYQLCSYRIGSQMLLALFTSIFGVDLSWKVFAPCVGAGIFYTVLNLFWIIERMGYKSKNLKYVLGIMLGFNVPILMWSAILGLLPQVYGFSLSVFLLGIFLNRDNFSISRDDIVFTSAIAASLMMVYNEIVPIICLVLLCLFFKLKF